jgi:hypothetical protein
MANKIEAGDLINGVDKLAKEIADLNKAVADLRDEFADTQKLFDKSSKSQTDLAKKTKAVSAADKELERIKGRQLKITKEVIKAQELEKKRVKELREEVQKDIGVTKQRTSFTKKLTNAFKLSVIQITAVIAAVKGIIAAGKAYVNNIKELNKNISQTAASFQLTREQAEGLTKDIRALAAAFDKEFNDVLKASNILAKEFGITGSEALGLIEDGFRKGADINGEFLELLKEYPAQLRSVGLSAKQSIAIITQTEQQGLFSDKGIDAIKEAGIRLRELTPATLSALNAIGLSGAEIQRQLESGEKTLFEVTQDVSAKLSELPPQSKEVGTAIADIFGGPGEDVGLRFLTTLKDIDTELDNIKTTLSPVEESSANLREQWKRFTDEITRGEGAASRALGFIQNTLAVQIGAVKQVLKGKKEENKETEDQIENIQKLEDTEVDYRKKQLELAKARKTAREKEIADNITRLEKELAERLALETAAKAQSDALADALVDEEIALTDEELNRLATQLDAEYQMQLEADKRYLEKLKAREEAANEIKAAAAEAAGQVVSDITSNFIDTNLAKFEADQEAQQDILKDRLDKGLISEKEFEEKSAALKLKGRQEQAKAEKKKALFDIAINTAVALVKQLGATPLPVGAPFLAAVAAIGAIQLAAAAAKPIPKFEKGGDVDGKRHSQGGTIIEAEKGEYVVNRLGTSNAHGALEMINKGLLKDSDLLPSSGRMFSGADTKELAQQNSANIIGMGEMIKEQRATRGAIMAKSNQPTLTRKGVEYINSKSKNKETWVNQYL